MRTLKRFAPGFKRIMVAVLAIAMLVSSVSFSKGTNAKAAASTIGSAEDYSVTATDVSDSLCRITFTPTNPAAYVIIHYKVNDGEQVNVGMNAKGSCFEYDINNVKKGDKIDCSFTYNKGGLQYDSSMMTYTTGSAPVTDTSIEAPFGLVVASPANGEISVVWGRGNVDSYNVYIDNALVGSKLGCGYYVYKGYAAGTHTVKVTTVSGNKESAAATASVNVTGSVAPTTKAPETTTKAPQTTKAPETTTKAPQTTKAPTSNIEAPFGLVVGNPEAGKISVVWGRGNIDSYNVYIDGKRVASAVGCGYYVYEGYAAGSHTVAITTTKNGNESAQTTMTVNVAQSAVAPTTKAPETTTKVPQTTKAPETTTKTPQTTEAIGVDSSLPAPFGLVASSPVNNQITVVWGYGTINSYNVYVDDTRVAKKVGCGSYKFKNIVAGTHTVSVATYKDGKESAKVSVTVTVNGLTEIATTAPAEKPTYSEAIPETRADLKANEDRMYFQMNNKTKGQYSDDQVYWCILGKNPKTHELCYVDTNGNLIPVSLSMNTVKKGDRMCANICNTLAQKDYVYMPDIESGRMYLSYGSPVYITINQGADGNMGFAGPDLNNASDPNADVLFEFIEFTITNKEYWGNTSRVDFYSFPMATRLIGEGGWNNFPGDADVYDKTVGDLGTRAEMFAAFKNEVPAAFQTLLTDKRIMAPCKLTFNEGKQYSNYFDNYINKFWSKYSTQDLVFSCDAGTFRGRVHGDTMVFTKDGVGGTYTIYKPTTQDVLEGKGNMARGNSTELVIEAQLCAAFNRGVATEPENYDNESAYYKNSNSNFYSGFFHNHSFDRLAYGFCYDDVNDHSTLLHYTNPTGLIIDLKW